MCDFEIGDIPYYNYAFSDKKGGKSPHFALILLPSKATHRWQGSDLCCVITSQKGNKWQYSLANNKYPCFKCSENYVSLDRKDYQAQIDLLGDNQPKEKLDDIDLKGVFRKLRDSLFAVKDFVYQDTYLRGTIIADWKARINKVNVLDL